MVVVAMSGGVDSSVVAAILHHQGYDVLGVTLKLHDFYDDNSNSCCGGSGDIYDAKKVSSQIGIKHYVLDLEHKFKKKVIDNFVESYGIGHTPLPCVRCNQFLKFEDLFFFAKKLGAKFLATGHYVKKITTNSGIQLHQAQDVSKDQSYFLFATTNDQLNFLEFPLGNYNKSFTRSLAEKYKLHVDTKKDSQDICFVPNNNYRTVISKYSQKGFQPGNIVHVDGFYLGKHHGIANYTIGQRRSLSISWHEALYVTKIDHKENIVYVGPKASLIKKAFIINDINILDSNKIFFSKNWFYLQVKIRSTIKEVKARLKFLNSKEILIELLENVFSIAPGQACVIYDKTQILGGGWITDRIY
ncbi:MAG: tRNA 2-thiouridine(34) synthase MnmA [Rickettsia sp.]|nr:tRNA 2-thiouridine(34) synthase MnmA [Rickettsia sp.]